MHCKGKRKKTKSVKSYGMSKKKPVKSYGMSKKKKPVKSYGMSKKLTGGRKKLDANKDGKISKADFKLLKGRKKK